MSEILVNNLTGKTAAGNITVTSEGGSATQSLQQGLAKAWVYGVGTGTPASQDSLNVSTIADNGTGEYGNNLTSSMNSANYPVHFTADNSGRASCIDGAETQTSSACHGNFYAKSTVREAEFFCCTVHGDLA